MFNCLYDYLLIILLQLLPSQTCYIRESTATLLQGVHIPIRVLSNKICPRSLFDMSL